MSEPGFSLSRSALASLRKHQRRYGRTRVHVDSIWVRELLPLLAARLCADLHNEPLPPLPPGYPDDVELISEQAWENVMRLICQGIPPQDALHQVGIRKNILDAYCRYEPRLRSHFNIARGIARRLWCPVEEILEDISNTSDSVRHICARRGVGYKRFLYLSRDPYVQEQYLEAKEMQRLQLDDANDSSMTAALDGAGGASRKALRQTMRAFNRTATRIRGLVPRRINARLRRAIRDPAGRLEAGVAARHRAAKA
jgi:hypothetical protein